MLRGLSIPYFIAIAFLALIARPIMATHMRAGFLSWRRARTIDGVMKQQGRAIVFNIRQVYFVEGAVTDLPTATGDTYTPQGSVGGLVDFGDGQTELITLTVTSYDAADRVSYFEAQVEHTFAVQQGDGPFVAHVSGCCRQKSAETAFFDRFRLETTIPSLGDVANEGSPAPALSSIQHVFKGDAAARFVVHAVDPDEQPMAFDWSTEAESALERNGNSCPSQFRGTPDCNEKRCVAQLRPGFLIVAQCSAIP